MSSLIQNVDNLDPSTIAKEPQHIFSEVPNKNKRRKLLWPYLDGRVQVYPILNYILPLGIAPSTTTFTKIKQFDDFEHNFTEQEKELIGRVQVFFQYLNKYCFSTYINFCS
jgi:hypothetical protein